MRQQKKDMYGVTFRLPKARKARIEDEMKIISASKGEESEVASSADTKSGSDDSDASSVASFSSLSAESDASTLMSDDEAEPNRSGEVPLEWYEDEDHLGYNIDGQKVLKAMGGAGSGALLKRIIAEAEDPENKWRVIVDERNGTTVRLTDTDIEIIRRLRRSMYPNASIDPSAWPAESDKIEDKIHPVASPTPPKRRFVPSKHETQQIKRIAKLIKLGVLRPPPPPTSEVTDLWGPNIFTDVTGQTKPNLPQLRAPRLPFPVDDESYNPPPEHYASSLEEAKRLREEDPLALVRDPRAEDAPPICLRRMEDYPELVTERFERCLDLYLCPRAPGSALKAAEMDIASLLPPLPSPRDLMPFPQHIAMEFNDFSHSRRSPVRGVHFSSCGDWLATIDASGRLVIWDVNTGMDVETYHLQETTESASHYLGGTAAVQWRPKDEKGHLLLAASWESDLFFIQPKLLQGDAAKESETSVEALLRLSGNDQAEAEKSGPPRWSEVDASTTLGSKGVRLQVTHSSVVSSIRWHSKGLYLAVVCPKSPSPSHQCVLHSLKNHSSKQLFRSSKGGQLQAVSFHPTKPHIFVATRTLVRQFDLKTSQLVRELISGAKWISSLSVHSSGDHIIASTLDCRVIWWDLDMSNKPFKTLRLHDKAVRTVALHPGHFPLMLSASDDGSCYVTHAKADTEDLATEPLLVPCVRLKDFHQISSDGYGLLDAVWHPKKPWLVTAGADGKIALWS